MATTEYGVNHPLAVKKWARSLMKEALKRTQALKFMGKDKNSVIYIKDELKSEGDKVTYGLRVQMQGKGRRGDSTLEGHEEAIVTYNDSLFIDQLRHATRSKGKMSEQRVPFSVRAEGRDGLADWWADRFDTAFFNQLCGNASETDVEYTGMNSAIEPTSAASADSNRLLILNDTYSREDSEASLGASDTFTLTHIDYAVEVAKVSTPLIRPIKSNQGLSNYVMFLHPFQVTSLRTNTDNGQWLDIQKSAMQGGKVAQNPIFTGALGVYNGVILHESTRIPTGLSASNVRRAVLCGAQAGCIAWGKGYGKNRMSWKEEMFDYGNQLGIAAGSIWGMKKSQFNSIDYGTIVVPSWAAAAT